ncbi:IclR family transcriptional regulator [Paenibacillus koleovorans]|uniref:IclR family transcriptional regulator n=1 Tax=Paenibacillus koleovorans TaxID=121608 RepID=UPI000FD8EF0F|nr:IclR family transcriptional regulator [Paenibacillus koleovorans]
MKKKNTYIVPALEKGLLIMEKLSASDAPLRLTDIHEQMGIAKTSVFMIMSTLETMGYVEKVDENRYRVSMKLYNMGIDILSHYDIRGIAKPYMEQLAEQLRLTVHLASMSEGKAIYIEKVNGPNFVQFGTRVGQSFRLHLSAIGKAFAAYLEEHKLDEIFKENPMIRATENSITSLEVYKKFLKNVREVGYAIEDEECEVGVRSIAAPIFNNEGKVVAAMGVTAVRNDLPSVSFHEVGTIVKDYCLQVSKRLEFVNL